MLSLFLCLFVFKLRMLCAKQSRYYFRLVFMTAGRKNCVTLILDLHYRFYKFKVQPAKLFKVPYIHSLYIHQSKTTSYANSEYRELVKESAFNVCLNKTSLLLLLLLHALIGFSSVAAPQI
jgi:hypothetical protein